ncbi:MAG: TIGR03618 family F420-dependent PPOX class oxidoreductase [Actinomycetota bacterium]
MKRLEPDDPRAAHVATETTLDADGLATHLTGRHQWVLATARRDARPQLSLVSGGQLPDGRLAIASYPMRAKSKNARRDDRVSILVLGERFDHAWIQIDGDAVVLDAEADGAEGAAALDAFVAYFRAISGEHPDWDEYRQAMVDQGKSIILVTPTRWGPLSTGGFPPELFTA